MYLIHFASATSAQSRSEIRCRLAGNSNTRTRGITPLLVFRRRHDKGFVRVCVCIAATPKPTASSFHSFIIGIGYCTIQPDIQLSHILYPTGRVPSIFSTVAWQPGPPKGGLFLLEARDKIFFLCQFFSAAIFVAPFSHSQWLYNTVLRICFDFMIHSQRGFSTGGTYCRCSNS
jgi:hypothetical protein